MKPQLLLSCGCSVLWAEARLQSCSGQARARPAMLAVGVPGTGVAGLLCEGQVMSILDFASHFVSVTNTKPCCCR